MADDEEQCGPIFQGGNEVVCDGEPLLLPAAEAQRWKPDAEYWADHMAPAAGRGGAAAPKTRQARGWF
jgi:hypothetical protein